ncbi:MAG: transposase [Betaproteobacteria bacterium]|nr:transposase [Betaproteobacteria bacterium]
MARLPRLTIGGLLHHVLHRGNDGVTVFRDEVDRLAFVELLRREAPASGVDVHAYLLLPDQYQLLLTPRDGTGLPRLLQQLGRAYVRRYNQRHGRRGTLWEGRYRSTLVDAEQHALDVMVSVDFAAGQAEPAVSGADVTVSSHAQYAGLATVPWLVAPSAYWALGNTPFAREQTYRQRVQQGLPEALQRDLQRAVETGWLFGSAAFKQQVEQRAGRRVAPGRPGRPAKLQASVDSVPK